MLPALCVKYIFGAIHNWNTTVMFLWIIQDAFFHLKAAGGGGVQGSQDTFFKVVLMKQDAEKQYIL